MSSQSTASRQTRDTRRKPPAVWVIADPVIAAVAAHAALTAAGVVRVEPGIRGLLGGTTRAARQRLAGGTPAPTRGVRVYRCADTITVELDIVVSGRDQAAAVGRAVQRVVRTAVRSATGVRLSAVTVTILDIDQSNGET